MVLSFTSFKIKIMIINFYFWWNYIIYICWFFFSKIWYKSSDLLFSISKYPKDFLQFLVSLHSASLTKQLKTNVCYISQLEIVFCRDKIKLVSGSDSGSYFERGWHEVLYSVKDNNGLQGNCAFSFTVKGNFLVYRFCQLNYVWYFLNG